MARIAGVNIPNNKRVHIMAHSQGGMDARILASPGGLAGLSNRHGNTIGTVTTISSPHYGTAFADVLLDLIPGAGAQQLIAGIVNAFAGLIYGESDQNLLDATFLAVGEMDVFNASFPDEPSTRYFSTGSKIRTWNIFQHNPLLLALYVANRYGGSRLVAPDLGTTVGSDNDGAIPFRSMRWGQWLDGPRENFFSLGIDHLQITNAFYSGSLWFDVNGLYQRLAKNAKNYN